DQLLGETVVFLGRAVAPVDAIGLAEGCYLIDPVQELGVLRRGACAHCSNSLRCCCHASPRPHGSTGGGPAGVPMSTSDPRRRRVARFCPSASKTTRWPCRTVRKIEPARASGARSYSLRSVSGASTPSPVPGSHALL